MIHSVVGHPDNWYVCIIAEHIFKECAAHWNLHVHLFDYKEILPDWLTPWSRVIFEKLKGSQPSSNLSHFMECGGLLHIYMSLPPVPVLTQINLVPTPQSHFLTIHVGIILPLMPRCLKWSDCSLTVFKWIHIFVRWEMVKKYLEISTGAFDIYKSVNQFCILFMWMWNLNLILFWMSEKCANNYMDFLFHVSSYQPRQRWIVGGGLVFTIQIIKVGLFLNSYITELQMCLCWTHMIF
jgi:hypothetical protein